jgi:tetratricopeptide (TPR) repeat protein
VKYLSIIEDYFLGKLKGEALENFLAALKNDPELKNEFETYKKAFDFTTSQENSLINDIGKLKDFDFDPDLLSDIKKYSKTSPLDLDERQLLSILLSENLKYKQINERKFKRSKWIKVAALCALIIGLGITGILVRPLHYTDKELFKLFYSPYEHSFTTRSFSISSSKLFNEGTILYDNGKYDSALKLFERIADSLRYNDELYLVEGTCLIELGNYDNAIDKFKKINEDSLLYMSSLWYEGLCYLKLDDRKDARIIFQKLNSSEPFYQKQAKKLLKYFG